MFPGGVRGVTGVVGGFLLVLFLLGGLGVVSLPGAAAPPPSSCGGPTVCPGPWLAVPAPQVTGIAGQPLNVTVSVHVFGTPPGVVTLTSATLYVGSTTVPLTVPGGPLSSYTFAPSVYAAPRAGTYTASVTVHGVATATGSTLTVVSATTSFTVSNSNGTAPPASCDPDCPSAVPGLALSGYGLVVNATDSSLVKNGVGNVTLAWGDGSTTSTSVGSVVSHKYASAGLYTVTDTVTVVNGSYTATASTTLTTQVAPGQTAPSHTTQTGAPTSLTTNFTWVVDAGIGVSIGILVAAITGRYDYGLVVAAVLGTGGALFGAFL